MRVTPIPGEPLRYRVASETNPEKKYLVELDANHNAGQCECTDWRMRIGPLQQDDYQRKIRRRCKHLRAAMEFFSESILDMVSEQVKAQRKKEIQERANREAATLND